MIPLICPIYCSSVVRREELIVNFSGHSVWWWTLLGTLCIVDPSWDTLYSGHFLGHFGAPRKTFQPPLSLMRVLYSMKAFPTKLSRTEVSVNTFCSLSKPNFPSVDFLSPLQLSKQYVASVMKCILTKVFGEQCSPICISMRTKADGAYRQTSSTRKHPHKHFVQIV